MKHHTLYLMLTEFCPNRCEYCYIKHRDNPSSMTQEQIDSYIEKYDPYRIVFFGGEPLVRLDLMEETIKKYYNKLNFQVVTSTSVNWKEFLKFNKEYPIKEIQVSWDGFNHNRINVNKEDTAQTVYNNIWYAIENGLHHFDIKSVISNDNVKDLLDIHKIFKYEFRPRYAYGQFVFAHRDYYADEYFKFLDRYLLKTFDLSKLYVEHINRINAYLNQDSEYSSCDGGQYMVITPSGKVNYCTALSQQDEIDFTADRLQVSCEDPECKECKYNYMCDGGCRFERYNAFGKDWNKKHLQSTCTFIQIYVKAIERFLNSLSDHDWLILEAQIRRFKEWIKSSYGRKEMCV